MKRPLLLALTLAGVKLAVQLVALGGYGWFRDELYYVACSEHLAWGYVDHPPFSIAVLAVMRVLFGTSLLAFRLVPALAGAFVVLGSGLLAMELGGGALAVTFTASAILGVPAYAAFHHYYSMNSLDHALWIAAALVATPLLRGAPRKGGDTRLSRWLGLGLLLGIGVLNKWSVLWLTGGLAFAIVATPARRWLLTPGPWLAALVAAGVAAPNFWWQAQHDWPTLEFASNALKYKYVARSPLAFLKDVLLLGNPFLAPLWLVGLVLPFTAKGPSAPRPVVLVFLLTLGILLASPSAKAEYLLAAFPLAFAAGAVTIEARLRTWLTAGRERALCVAGATFSLLLGAAFLPLALPVLPVDAFLRYQKALGLTPGASERKEMGALPQFYADMTGWDVLVDGAVQALATIRPEEGSPVVFATTGGYGPAAAIDVLGHERGLPHAFSAHNSYWLWGPPRGVDDRPVILLGGTREQLEGHFASLTLVTTIECGNCMPYENHKPVYVGRGLHKRWADLWPPLKHYE